MTTPFPRQMAVTLPTDERGYLGRECPAEECLGYFLIRLGTGLTGADLPCHCPYCGLVGPMTHFHTPEQIEYAKSVVVRQFAEHALQRLKQHEFNRPAKGAFGIGISLTVKPGRPLPISHYRERTLETAVTCTACTLEYAVYGVFGFCPDCGVHNSLQILALNLDLTRRQVALASTLDDAPLRRHLLEDALENCVSALDGFGRESIRVRAHQSNDPPRCAAVSFQNLGKAAVLVTTLFGIDLIGAVPTAVWTTATRGFMKRHVVSHRAGVVDQAYLDQTSDPSAVLGRKIAIDASAVVSTADAVLQIGEILLGLLPPTGPTEASPNVGNS